MGPNSAPLQPDQGRRPPGLPTAEVNNRSKHYGEEGFSPMKFWNRREIQKETVSSGISQGTRGG